MTEAEHKERELKAEQNYSLAIKELVTLYGENWSDQHEDLINAIWHKHHFRTVPLDTESEEVPTFDPKIRYLWRG